MLQISFSTAYGNPMDLTLRDIDIVSWKAIKRRQGRVHVYAMLETHVVRLISRRFWVNGINSQMRARS